MRVLLVAPCREGQRWKGKGTSRFLWPPSALMILAASTPDDVDLTLVDEAIQDIPFDRDFDLVGVSAITATAMRAYEIADAFRERGVPVILGGIHASFRPEEAQEHGDSVFVGEADEGWAEVLDDVRSGRGLKRRYEATGYPELAGRPSPRRDLFPPKSYKVSGTVMASRGCPHNCSFCSTTKFMGPKLRVRPVGEVLEEIRSLPGRIMIFTDDNLFAHKAWAMELMRGMAGMGKRFVAQCSIEASRRDDLLAAARKAGCMGVLIGFESLSSSNLQDVKKGINKTSDYIEAVDAFRARGLLVQGSFIFGLDGDTEASFGETVDFVFRAKLGAANFAVLTPLPGTEVFDRLDREGRITTYDWSKYDKLNVVFKPKGLTPERLQQGVKDAYRRVFSLSGIRKRVSLFRKNGVLAWLFNLNYRRGVMKGWD